MARQAWSRQASTISIGESEAQVEGRLGAPSRKLLLDSEASWYYSTPGQTFPNLGTVLFDASGRVSAVSGSSPPSSKLRNLSLDLDWVLQSIHSLPGFYGFCFDSKQLVGLASYLVSKPFGEVVIALSEYLRVRPMRYYEAVNTALRSAPRHDGDDGRLGMLLMTLLGGDSTHDVGRGQYIPGGPPSDPLMRYCPMVIVRGYPIVVSYGLIGDFSHRATVDHPEEFLLERLTSKGHFAYAPPQPQDTPKAAYDSFISMLDEPSAGTMPPVRDIDFLLQRVRRQLGLSNLNPQGVR